MYTGTVVRSVTFMLALLLAATPVLGAVCAMDCDPPPATHACHKAADAGDAPTVRGAPHRCDHDHSTGSPALVPSTGARDSGGILLGLPLATLAHASLIDARVAIAALHGPPGLSGRNTTPSLITVLRI